MYLFVGFFGAHPSPGLTEKALSRQTDEKAFWEGKKGTRSGLVNRRR